jgi:hypothetical protein
LSLFDAFLVFFDQLLILLDKYDDLTNILRQVAPNSEAIQAGNDDGDDCKSAKNSSCQRESFLFVFAST